MRSIASRRMFQLEAPWSILRGRFATPQDEAIGCYNDSEMVPEAIEITQNGLGQRRSPSSGARAREDRSHEFVSALPQPATRRRGLGRHDDFAKTKPARQ